MRYKTNNLCKRIIAAVLLLATLAGTTTLMGNKVQAACSHSSYTTITVVSQPSCSREGSAYCKCNSCGQYFYKTLSATGHKPYVKDVNGYTQLRCAICETRFYYTTTPKTLDDFAGYLYGKKFSQLSGSLTSGQKQNVAANWISYAYGCAKSKGMNLSNKASKLFRVEVKDVSKYIDFIGKCENLASRYNYDEASAVVAILTKSSLADYLLNPAIVSKSDIILKMVKKINSPAGSILKSYKTITEALIAITLFSTWDVMATEFGIYCSNYGITFDPPTKKGGDPVRTPTYEQLFNTTNGKTNLDRFIGYLLNDSSKGFKELCNTKNVNRVYYSYVILWLVRPALNKKLAECTNYKTVTSLIEAAKKYTSVIF